MKAIRSAASLALLVSLPQFIPGFQAPEKARVNQEARTSRFKGTIVLPEPAKAEPTGFAIVKVDDEVKVMEFAVRLTASETGQVSTVSSEGERIAPDKVREALSVAGRPISVDYIAGGSEPPVAILVELGPVATTRKTAKGLDIEDLVIGTGAEAQRGDHIAVHYTGWLKDGRQFDSSRGSGKPLYIKLGSGQVIRGWDLGIVGMRVGGKRKLTIAHYLAYGSRGAGGTIPPYATLVFEIELVKIE